MRDHQLPLPGMGGDVASMVDASGQWQTWADCLFEACHVTHQLRVELATMESGAIDEALAILDEVADRAQSLGGVLQQGAGQLLRYAHELDGAQVEVLVASDEDERAHQEYSAATRRLGGFDADVDDDPVALLRWQRRQTEAEEDERRAMARWDQAGERRDAAASVLLNALPAVAVGRGAGSEASPSERAHPASVTTGVSFRTISTSGPAVQPEVDNQTLRSILGDIYSTRQDCVGDGKVGTALLNEIETGQQTRGRWHAVDAADQLTRLVELLENDRKPNRLTQLSDADRALALREAGELYDALTTPLDPDSPLARSITSQPSAQASIDSLERKLLDAPSVSLITGVEFEVNAKGRPVPTPSSRVGRLLGGLGVVGDVLSLIEIIRILDDPVAMNRYLCNAGFTNYCRLDPNLTMA